MYRQPGKIDTSELHVPLLDINPEGRLQREIKDILEELDIMILVNRTQRDVLRDLIMHVEHILDPKGHFSPNNRHKTKNIPTVNLHVTPPDSILGMPRMSVGAGDPVLSPLSPVFEEGPRLKGPLGGGGEDDEKKRAAREQLHRDRQDRRMEYDWFKINAEELLAKVSQRIEELEQLRRSAHTTSNSVRSAFFQDMTRILLTWP